ncbi:hypothetical protein [Neptuniibacter marinus]|uniref:hypothetical protein n=1 Tax=Neptuniibacter marinus TaxID=1806670 RepID=UPI003B58E1E0
MTLPTGVAAVFPFSPDWSTPVKQLREFKTDVITSRDGTEQRRALRSKPRDYIEYQVLLDGHDSARLDYYLWALQPHVLMLPIWPSKRYLSLSVDAGESVLVLDKPVGDGSQVGDEWVLVNDNQEPEVFALQSISGDGLTLGAAQPMSSDWSKKSAVYPAWRVHVNGDIGASKLTSSVMRAPLSFKRLVGSYEPFSWTAEAELTIDGLEVLLRKMNWNNAVSTEHQWSAQFVDSQSGPFTYELTSSLPVRVYKGTALEVGRDEVSWYQAFFDRVRGRQTPFLMPTWQNDLQLQTPVGLTDFEVAGTELGRFMPTGPIHSHLMLRKRDGSFAFFAVQSIEADYTLGVTSIATVEPWDELYGPEDCLFVCFVNTVRLVSDTLSISWVTDDVANISLAVQTVEVVT